MCIHNSYNELESKLNELRRKENDFRNATKYTLYRI